MVTLISAIVYGLLAALCAAIISPLQFLKIMRQKTFNSYTSIFHDNVRNEGWKVLYRGVKPYILMNFIANLSFGLADSIYIYIYQMQDRLDSDEFIQLFYIPVYLFMSFLFRPLLGGLIETTFTFYHEICEINSNKGLRQSITKDDLKLIPFLILRNSISWIGIVLSYEIILFYMSLQIPSYSYLNINSYYFLFFDVLVTVFFAILFSFVSLPFDVLVTICAGENNKQNLWQKLFYIMQKNYRVVFSGFFMRALQIVIYNLVTVGTMHLIRCFIFPV